MSKKSRDKGKRGERQVIDWLQPHVNDVYEKFGLRPVLLQRNTVQSDRGGSDICGLDWLAAEIKNCESQGPALMHEWWKQCEEQACNWSKPGKPALIPALFYTRNRQPIRVRLRGFICPGTEAYSPALVDVSAEDFVPWFVAKLEEECRATLRGER